MSDHEMQSFSGDEQKPSPSQDWSQEQPSVSPDSVPIARVDKQSLDQVWGRLEEHVSRNSSYYRHNRNVPALYMQDSSREKLQYERPAHFLRSLSWRRLDTIAAVVFLALLMGSLLTVVYHVQQTTQLGSSGADLSSDSVVCDKIKVQTQVVTIVKGQKGIEGQQLPFQKEPLQLRENAKVVIQVVNLAMIVPTANGAAFQPMKIALPQDATLVWLNATQDKQVVVDINVKQDPLVLPPNACYVQHGISSGDHIYQLKGGSSSQLFLKVS